MRLGKSVLKLTAGRTKRSWGKLAGTALFISSGNLGESVKLLLSQREFGLA